ncbi:MAG: DUF4296 domain-containing protein [Ferruginibacter sp.]
MTRLLFFSVLLFFSCKSGIPSGILKPEKMQTVMWDIIRADVFTENFIAKDSAKNMSAENIKLQNQIFAINSVSREDYYKSYEYYKKHPVVMTAILDSISQRVIRDRDKIIPAPDSTVKKKLP